jgi:hypothetical protein
VLARVTGHALVTAIGFALVVGVAVIPPAVAALGANDGGVFPAGAASEPRDRGAFVKGCPGFLLQDYAPDQPCRVEATSVLDSIGTRDLEVVKYFRERDGTSYEEVVLLERVDGGRAKPIWHDHAERDLVIIERVDVVESGRATLLDVSYCATGTMGCYQVTFVARADAWVRLERDGTWDALEKMLPTGFSISAKSPRIDFRTMRHECNVAVPGDPYCCPSGRFDLELAIADDKLTIRSHRLVLPSPADATGAVPAAR